MVCHRPSIVGSGKYWTIDNISYTLTKIFLNLHDLFIFSDDSHRVLIFYIHFVFNMAEGKTCQFLFSEILGEPGEGVNK